MGKVIFFSPSLERVVATGPIVEFSVLLNRSFSSSLSLLKDLEQELSGWKASTRKAGKIKDLRNIKPSKAESYFDFGGWSKLFENKGD